MRSTLAELPVLDASLPLPLALLVAALDALTAQAPADLPGAEALLQAQALLVQQDRLRALTLARLGDVHRRQLHELEGAPSTAAWVAQQQTSTTRAEVALAGKLDQVPLVAARIAAGGLSVDSGIKIARAIGALRRHCDSSDGLIDGQPGEQVVTAVVVDGVRMLVAESAKPPAAREAAPSATGSSRTTPPPTRSTPKPASTTASCSARVPTGTFTKAAKPFASKTAATSTRAAEPPPTGPPHDAGRG